MLAPKNLIHETSTSTGTGNFTLVAENGKVRFSDAVYGFNTGGTDVFDYFISNSGASEWEIGTGSMSDADTLVRDTVVLSSNSNSLVNFTAGVKNVTNDIPASQQNVAAHSIVSPAVLGADDVQGALEALADPGSTRVGEFFWYLGDSPPAYALELDGSAISRTTFARLWTWVQANGKLAASQGAKTAGEFGPGDGSTTFTLPDFVTLKYFIRASSTVGTVQDHAFEDHTHDDDLAAPAHTHGIAHTHSYTLAVYSASRQSGGSNASTTTTNANTSGASSANSGGASSTTLSGSVGNADSGNADSETRPRNISLLPCVVF